MLKNLSLSAVALLLLGGLAWLLLPSLFGKGRDGGEPEAQDPAQIEAGNVDPATAAPAEGSAATRTSVAGGQAPGSGASDAGQAALVLHGRVVDAFQQPVAGASVALEAAGRGMGFGPPRKPVATGPDGRFELRAGALGRGGPNAMHVTLLVTDKRFAPLYFDRGLETGKGDVELGDIVVTKGGAILGSVTDLDGNAVPGATALLKPAGPNRLSWAANRDELLPKVEVDPRGAYVISSIMPGEYRVEATAPRKTVATSDVITVRDGRQEQLDALRLGPGHALTGMVVASDNLPVAGAEVSLSGSRSWSNQQAQTDKKGEFAFDHLSSEPVTLRVQAKGFQSLTQANVAPATTAPLTLRLQDGLKITGVVRDAQTGAPVTLYSARPRRIAGLDDGKAAQAAEAMRMADMAELEKMIGEAAKRGDQVGVGAFKAKVDGLRASPGLKVPPPADPNSWQWGNGPRGSPTPDEDPTPHPDGKFELLGLDEGIWVVEINSRDHQRVRSEQVTLRNGTPAPNLDIALPRGFDICGRTISSADGTPVVGAVVDLLPAAPQQRDARGTPPLAATPGQTKIEYRTRGRGPGPLAGPGGGKIASAVSDKEGKFALRHLAPGRYKLVARADGHAPKSSAEIELAADRGDEVLSLGTLARLAGRLLDLQRAKGAPVTVLATADGGPATTKAKEDGSYELSDLQPGSYVVRAFVGDVETFLRLEMGGPFGGPGRNRPKPDVTLEEGDAKALDLKLTLHPVGAVEGLVQKNGLPAPGLRVTLQPLDGPAAKDAANGGTRYSVVGNGGGPIIFGNGPVPSANTDQRGEFRMPDVPEGRYLLKVQRGAAMGFGPGNFVMSMGGPSENDYWRQEVFVRAEQTTRVDAAFQLGILQGKVTLPDGEKGEVNGNLTLFMGASSVPPNVAEFQKTSPVAQVPVRNGAFKSEELQSGDWLGVLKVRGREQVVKGVSVPIGEGSPLEMVAGKVPPKK